MLTEIRQGVRLLAVISLLTHLSALGLLYRFGTHPSILYTYGLLALLSVHVIVSSRWTKDTNAISLLGTVLLVITGVAVMAIAHRSGAMSAWLLSSIVLIYMVIPVVPWGMRDACLVVTIVYCTVTFSTFSVEGRFSAETAWMLQFLIIASAAAAMLVVARNTLVRKNDMLARHELESAHRHLQLISTQDPMTGAWNRRYLEREFESIAEESRAAGADLHLAVLDIDGFKQLNDTYGHRYGDDVLKRLAEVLMTNMPGTTRVLRLGGDEFAVIGSCEDFEGTVRRCLEHLETDPQLVRDSGRRIRVSSGFSVATARDEPSLDELYRVADTQLYGRKSARQQGQATGVWQRAKRIQSPTI